MTQDSVFVTGSPTTTSQPTQAADLLLVTGPLSSTMPLVVELLAPTLQILAAFGGGASRFWRNGFLFSAFLLVPLFFVRYLEIQLRSQKQRFAGVAMKIMSEVSA